MRMVVLGAVTALVVGLAGCTADEADRRSAGDPVTAAEAQVLAQALTADREQGGADFVLSAPYAEHALLVLTGEVDFAGGTGRAQALTSPGQGQPDRSRTVFFTGTELWQSDVPGLAEALTAAGLPAATYARRPLVPAGGTATPPLLDVLVQAVTRLSATDADDPRAFADWTWAGSESVDGRLATVYRSDTGTRAWIDEDSDLLVQYVTPLQDFDVTITLADHGERQITVPADTDTVDTTAHPEIAAALDL